MGKIIFSLLICLFFFTSHAEGSSLHKVDLWQSDELVIQSVLSEEWLPFSAEELDTLRSGIDESITRQSGKIVAGFQFEPDTKNNNSSHNTRIIVFVKTAVDVNQDMIQKTFVWLNKNETLLSGMLPDKVGRVGIQNIEYIQKLPAILFQQNLAVNNHPFTGLSSIVFLKNSILNIVCLSEEKEFAGHEGIFRSFIDSVTIPSELQHFTVLETQPTSLLSEILALLERKWHSFVGVFLIVGIYGWVFLTGREKRV
ncbi:hypothetical protein ACFLZ5_08045 [Thermodesulfobacteriota bacterium]